MKWLKGNLPHASLQTGGYKAMFDIVIPSAVELSII